MKLHASPSRLRVIAPLACAAVACSSDAPPPTSAGALPADARLVATLVAALQRGFRVGDGPLMKRSPVERFTRDAGALTATLPAASTRGVSRPASVKLPERATGAFEVVDQTSGVALKVTRVGARDAPAELDAGFVVYRGALDGADVLHRVHAEGTEDFAHFAARPAREELRYRVDVERAHGLRLLGNVLEVMDARGYPRLRMTAPAAIDAAGERVALTTRVEGCAFDTSPAPPWSRPTVAPGASECEVVIEWRASVYPLLVDPGWGSSGHLAHSRSTHTATALPDGSVLVVGGFKDSYEVARAELWSDGAFALADSLEQARRFHTATALPDGSVLVVGGLHGVGLPTIALAERWNGVAFAAAGSLAQARAIHTATALPDGSVLVVGGWSGDQSIVTAERWSDGAFAPAGLAAHPRHSHTATALPDGSVLVVGGQGHVGGTWASVASAELWGDGDFTSAGSLAQARARHTATALPDGSVLVVGGDGASTRLASAELWSAGGFAPAGTLAMSRAVHTATALLDGSVLVVGGFGPWNQWQDLASCELWSAGAFSPAGSLAESRADHTATALPDGSVLVVGGYGASGHLSSAERTCPVASADGVCCNVACDGPCEACVAAKTGQPDGTCAPILAGTDPDDECAPKDALHCQASGMCDGAGACEVNPTPKCPPAACLDATTQLNASPCDAAGDCVSPAPPASTCAPYACKGSGCLTSCADGSDCAPGNPCVAGECLGPRPDGKPCASADGSDCLSGFCVIEPGESTGLCCNTACADACTACTASRTEATDGECNPVVCPGGLACADDACPASCTVNSQCAAGAVCVKGACVQPKANGKWCDVEEHGAECVSGFCVDGVCCESPCDGQCQLCDVAGKLGQCLPVSKDGSPHNLGEGLRKPCDGGAHPLCKGTCDGVEVTSCVYPGPSVTCGSACANGAVTLSTCDAEGSCEPQAPKPCAPWACDTAGIACISSCKGDRDCAPDAKCEDGKCNFECSTDAECDLAGGFTCVHNECKPSGAAGAGGAAAGGAASTDAAPSGANGGGCGCAYPRRQGGLGVGALALLGALFTRRRARVVSRAPRR